MDIESAADYGTLATVSRIDHRRSNQSFPFEVSAISANKVCVTARFISHSFNYRPSAASAEPVMDHDGVGVGWTRLDGFRCGIFGVLVIDGDIRDFASWEGLN